MSSTNNLHQKNKSHANQIIQNNKKHLNANPEKEYKISLLNLDLKEQEHDYNSDNNSVYSIKSENMDKIKHKPMLMDLPLPLPSVEKLNSNKQKFKVKCAANKSDHKVFSGELDNIQYEGKCKSSDFKPSK